MKARFLFFVIAIFYFSALSSAEIHEFRGKHMIINYLECDISALIDEQKLIEVMLDAVQKCGSHILNHNCFIFPGHGLTMTILLSESYASIHTYPEHGKCFVDLFTCGDKCDHDVFDSCIREHLKPKSVITTVLLRDDAIKEIVR